jgi:hypothetical protein
MTCMPAMACLAGSGVGCIANPLAYLSACFPGP